jgi:hypothetical protein
MKLLKRLLGFYINSSIHVALAVCCLLLITVFDFELSLNKNLLFFTFFATITGYNFVKYFGLAKFHHRRLSNWLKYIQIFSLIAFVGLCYFMLKLETKTLFYLACLGVVTFLYAIPLLPKKYFLDASKNLRAISGLKIYIIAFVWSVVTVIIPVVNANILIGNDIIVTMLQRFLFVIAITLPFEIRDMQFDNLKLGTIPQRIGVKQTKIIGCVLLILFCLMEFFKDEVSQIEIMVTIIMSLLVAGFLVASEVRQPKYYSSFWVEGLPIIWFVLILFYA